jgi:predicted DsbA family dithiol-disulfide isomerase
VGDKGVLADLAAAGIDRAGKRLPGRTEGADEVAEAEAASKRSGMNGVPTFVINGRPSFSGAQRAELMLAHVLDAVGPP